MPVKNDDQIEKAIKSAEEIATAGMNSAQKQIDFIQAQRLDLLIKNIGEIRKWQSVLATVSFSLAAAIAPFLLLAAPKSHLSPYLTIGFLLLLANGALISLRIKTLLEEENTDLMTLGTSVELQQLEKKKAALMWYHDIQNPAKYENYTKAEQSIHNVEGSHRSHKHTVDYTNDLGVAFLVYAIYLMAHDLTGGGCLYLLGLTLIPLFFIIFAVRGGMRSKAANKKLTDYLNENKRHSKEWSKFIDQQYKH